MDQYPIFCPPHHPAEKEARNWTKKEAEGYRNWLVSHVNTRTDFLLSFIGVECTGRECEEILRESGSIVAQRLMGSPFSENHEATRKPTAYGYALCTDMGLLVARFIINSCEGRVRWEILKGHKREMSYNLPVLVGFQNNCHLDPVGGSIAKGFGILAGRRSGEIWRDMFSFWVARID